MTTVRDVIEKVYTKVNGEYEAVAESSDDFKTYLGVLNQAMEVWATTPYVKWQSLFDANYRLPDPVAIGKLQYDFPDMDRVIVANTPFDSIYFVDDNNVVIKKHKMVDQALFQHSNAADICMLASDGLHLKQVTDDMVGLYIRLPVYLLPPRYTSANQTVRIDNVPWLIMYMAAFIADASPVPFIARNAEKFYKQADIQMKSMRANNRHRQTLSLKRVTRDDDYPSLSAAIDAGVGICNNGGVETSIDGGVF